MTSKRTDNSYRSILKGFSLFGSVEMLKIIVDLVRGKLVALFLGPDGMGVSALFASAAQTVQRFSSLGLNLALVKEVASTADEPDRLGHTLGIARRLIVGTAILGALVCLFGCRWLSLLTFDTVQWWPMFMLLGLMVLLTSVGNGLLALLQGLHEVKRISKASLVSALAGLTLGVPLYWWLGIDGIVPAMVVLAAVMAGFYWIALRGALRATPSVRQEFSWQRHGATVKKLAGLGIVLMAADLIGSGCTYALNIFLNYFGDFDTVGLYQSANSLTTKYSGMVFSALALDYFPRLSAVASDNNRMYPVVNRQIEMVGYVVTPIVCALILTAPWVIRLLLTAQFEPITPLMRWMGLAVLLKALMFPLGYITFAKDNKRVFFWLEGITGNLLTLTMSAGGYMLFGLIGLGYGMVADCCLCLLIYWAVNRRLYGFNPDGRALRAAALALGLGTCCFAAASIPVPAVSVAAMGIVAAASGFISFFALRERLRGDRRAARSDSADGA